MLVCGIVEIYYLFYITNITVNYDDSDLITNT